MIRSTRRRKVSGKTIAAWLAGYAVVLAAIVVTMFVLRGRILHDFDTPEARAQWQAWREAEPNQPNHGPVKRKPPATAEPPALLLMRDHFAVILSGAIVFGSLLFAALALAAKGALSRTDAP